MAYLTPKIPRLNDLLKVYFDDRYCFDVVAIKNTSAGSIAVGASLFGQPYRLNAGVYETVQTPNEANATGIIIETTPVATAIAAAATSTQKFRILTCGPAIVNSAKLATLDVAGGTFVQATLLTRYLAANPPIKTFREAPSSESKTQTT